MWCVTAKHDFTASFGGGLCRCATGSRHGQQLVKVAQNAGRIGFAPSEQPEGSYCLEHCHSAAVYCPAAECAGARKKFGLDREVDDVGNPEFGPQRLRR